MEALGTHTCMCLEGFSGSACESKYCYYNSRSCVYFVFLFFFLFNFAQLKESSKNRYKQHKATCGDEA